MKKFIAIIFVLSIFCLTACNTNTKHNSDPSDNSSTVSENVTSNSGENSTESDNTLSTVHDTSADNSSENSAVSEDQKNPSNESSSAITNEIAAQFELPSGDPVDLTNAVVNGINGQISVSEITEDNWLSVTCDYVYLAEPLGVSYNSVDNADIFDKNNIMFTGIPETVPHKYKKYKVGDTFGSLKLVEASTSFIPDWFYMSPKYFNGGKVRFEGEITLTGKCRIAPESVDYATARDIQFVPDAKSTLPVMLYAVDENGGDALNYVMNDDFCCIGEYYSIVLGNADDYSNLDLSGIPDDGSFVDVKVTISNIFYRNELNFNRVFSGKLVNIEIV